MSDNKPSKKPLMVQSAKGFERLKKLMADSRTHLVLHEPEGRRAAGAQARDAAQQRLASDKNQQGCPSGDPLLEDIRQDFVQGEDRIAREVKQIPNFEDTLSPLERLMLERQRSLSPLRGRQKDSTEQPVQKGRYEYGNVKSVKIMARNPDMIDDTITITLGCGRVLTINAPWGTVHVSGSSDESEAKPVEPLVDEIWEVRGCSQYPSGLLITEKTAEGYAAVPWAGVAEKRLFFAASQFVKRLGCSTEQCPRCDQLATNCKCGSCI